MENNSFVVNGTKTWIDWDAFYQQQNFKLFREFCLHSWIINGKPNIKDEGNKITYPDRIVITMKNYLNGEYERQTGKV